MARVQFSERPVSLGEPPMIDGKGYRANVGMIISNSAGRVLWGRRAGGTDAWQFPQGGIKAGEDLEQALYRELYEEVGLRPTDVKLLSVTKGWLRYQLPRKLVRARQAPMCIGQKQKWYLLELLTGDESVSLDHSPTVEFDEWRWVSYWYPLNQVIAFKKEVYRRALKALSPAHGQLERQLANTQPLNQS
jgi:putative (di)nucleoside polyphosphate hydrolase